MERENTTTNTNNIRMSDPAEPRSSVSLSLMGGKLITANKEALLEFSE